MADTDVWLRNTLGTTDVKLYDVQQTTPTPLSLWLYSDDGHGDVWLRSTSALDTGLATGSLAVVLGNATSNSSGAHGVAGTLSAHLADATSGSSGGFDPAGTVSVLLGDATLSASGSEVVGSTAVTLASATLAASGAHGVAGTAASTFASMTLAATGSEAVGSGSTTFGAMASDGVCGVGDGGTLAVTLQNATLAASGTQTPLTAGIASAVLGESTCSASGGSFSAATYIEVSPVVPVCVVDHAVVPLTTMPLVLGSRLVLAATFKSPLTNAPIDPPALQLRVSAPAAATDRNPRPHATIATYVYGSSSMVRDGVGKYHVDFVCAVAGVYRYQWKSIASGLETIEEGSFTVLRSAL